MMAWLTKWPMRRWFRVLWCILALGCLGGLPWLIMEFSRADFSIHYQVQLSPKAFTVSHAYPPYTCSLEALGHPPGGLCMQQY